MKFIVLFIIKIYQIILSPLLKTILGTSRVCRYTPSCSEYAKRSFIKYGFAKGLRMSFARFITCQPFAK